MKTKIILTLVIMGLLSAFTASAFALPEPSTAHYPRGGALMLSPAKEMNNTFAFKASGLSHGRVHVQIIDAYAENCDTKVFVQMHIVNEWGNWITFGESEAIVLNCVPTTFDLYFPIRARQAFCIVVSTYGISGRCTIPYMVNTD